MEDLAWYFWTTRQHNQVMDDKLVEPFLNLPLASGWLKRSRKALFYSAGTVARRLDIAVEGYYRFERAEVHGDITIKALRKCAEAMDCELVYALRPKQKQTYSKVTFNIVLKAVNEFRPYRDFKFKCEKKLCHFIKRVAYDPVFRRSQGWCRNTEPESIDATWGLRTSRWDPSL